MQLEQPEQIDQQLLRTLSRQIRSIKVMLGVFFVFFLAMLAILGFITYKVVTFTQDVSSKITNLQTSTSEALDVKSKVCDNKTLSGLLSGNTDLCK